MFVTNMVIETRVFAGIIYLMDSVFRVFLQDMGTPPIMSNL